FSLLFDVGQETPALPASLGATASGSGYVIVTKEPIRVLHDLTGWALTEAVELEDLTVSKPSLEDVYLELTGGVAGTEGAPPDWLGATGAQRTRRCGAT